MDKVWAKSQRQLEIQHKVNVDHDHSKSKRKWSIVLEMHILDPAYLILHDFFKIESFIF